MDRLYGGMGELVSVEHLIVSAQKRTALTRAQQIKQVDYGEAPFPLQPAQHGTHRLTTRNGFSLREKLAWGGAEGKPLGYRRIRLATRISNKRVHVENDEPHSGPTEFRRKPTQPDLEQLTLPLGLWIGLRRRKLRDVTHQDDLIATP